MKICETLEEARAVPGVIHIKFNAQGKPVAYVAGDVLPPELTAPPPTLPEQQAQYDAIEPLLADIYAQAQAAIDANATYLAIVSPSAAQVGAQVRALTQQNQKIIKALTRFVSRERP